jgi:CheY-like chemotaxis protein
MVMRRRVLPSQQPIIQSVALRSVIAIVNDDPEISHALDLWFNLHGISSLGFTSVESLLKANCYQQRYIVSNANPDRPTVSPLAAMLDIHLPGINGIELARLLPSRIYGHDDSDTGRTKDIFRQFADGSSLHEKAFRFKSISRHIISSIALTGRYGGNESIRHSHCISDHGRALLIAADDYLDCVDSTTHFSSSVVVQRAS